MSDTSIKQLAELIGAPVDTLLQQLQDAGMKVSGADDSITDKRNHGCIIQSSNRNRSSDRLCCFTSSICYIVSKGVNICDCGINRTRNYDTR